MWRSTPRKSLFGRSTAILAALVLLALSSQRAVLAQVVPRGAQTVPTIAYDAALAALANGDFAVALETAGRDYAGGVRAGNQRWIDSIASATAIGESHYELGAVRAAVAAYDEAILLGATNSEWLLAVQFPAQGPQPSQRPRVATWGRSARGTKSTTFPDTMTIRQAAADPQKVLQQGGVLAAPMNVPIRPQEIMRALVIALYRRGVILGPLAGEGNTIEAINNALAKRPAPANHWSQSWIDVALGTAAWSQGRLDQAVPLLERGVTLGGKLDHPLTAWGLLVLGRIALDRDDAVGAARWFEEATYAAAEFGDSRALEEAFRMAFAAHQAAGTPGVPATIQGGCQWSRAGLPVLHATLLAHEAEALAAAGNLQGARGRLGDIDARFLRGDAGQGTPGAVVAHASALVAYGAGDATTGDADMERALAIARPRSPRLFQTGKLVEMVMAGATTISDRQADVLFARLLGDPPPRELVIDPLATLAAMTTPRQEAHEAWMLVAARRGSDAALAASEAAARARWLDTQPMGGRQLGIERLLGPDPSGLNAAAVAGRTGLLKRYPELAQIVVEDARLRTGLTAALLAAAGRGGDVAEAGHPHRAGPPGEPKDWESFSQMSARRGLMIDLLGAGREPIGIEFPPLLPPAEVRGRLAPGELVLSFHWSGSGVWGALESRDRVATWQIRQPAALARELTQLAKALCLFDPHVPVGTDRIVASDWRASAITVERLLFEQSKVKLSEGIEELVIVPDGPLWYLPFELLPAGSAGEPADGDEGTADAGPLLRDVCRIRYCPTRSLAVAGRPEAPAEPLAGRGPVGIHAGRPVRGERPEAIGEAVDRLTRALDRAVALPSQPFQQHSVVVSPALPAAICDVLVVLDEVNLAGEGPVGLRGLFGRPPDRGSKAGLTFNDWLASPHKRPPLVVVPGVQSAMASGLTKPVSRPGEELFIAATDLLAAGARTALVSRWRMGGKSTTDLVTEFVRDTDDPTAIPAASWQRAVDLVSAEEPDPALEGRIRVAGQTILTDMRHPLFWAGYMLVDGGTSVPVEGPAAKVAGGRAPAPAAAPKGDPAAAKGDRVRGAK
jgi:tetratricopeptide (TPR) repeat protein